MAKRKKAEEVAPLTGTTDAEIQEELVGLLADSLNKATKGELAVKAQILGDQEKSQADVKNWIPTGSDILDLAISNRPYGGIPTGRITEFTGLEQSGKSLLAAQLIASTQRMGGIGIFIDTENAVHSPFFEALGVDLKKMLYIPLELIEDVFEVIERIILDFKKKNTDKIITIVVDSVAATTTKVELEADYDKDGWSTAKAIIMSKSMRKVTNLVGRENIALVFTNQLRQKLGVSFGDQWTTSGGKALGFHASVRLRMANAGQIKDNKGRVIGMQTVVKINKNRMGPPLREVRYDIYFDSGIDNPGGWLKLMKEYDLVKQAGAWYTIVVESTGEEIKFQSKDFEEKVFDDEEIKKEIYDKICEAYILKYKKRGIDDVELDTEVIDEI